MLNTIQKIRYNFSIQFKIGKHWKNADGDFKQMVYESECILKTQYTVIELFFRKINHIFLDIETADNIYCFFEKIWLFFDRTIGVFFLFDERSVSSRTLNTFSYINRSKYLIQLLRYKKVYVLPIHYLFSVFMIISDKVFQTKYKTTDGSALFFHLLSIIDLHSKYEKTPYTKSINVNDLSLELIRLYKKEYEILNLIDEDNYFDTLYTEYKKLNLSNPLTTIEHLY